MRKGATLVVVAMAVGAGCGDSGTATTSTASSSSASASSTGAGGAGAGGAASIWSPCPLVTDGAGSDAECATFEQPAFYDEPSKGTVHVFVKRHLAKLQPAVGQLWLLQGGPGGSSIGFEGFVPLLSVLFPSLDVYLVDHRGVGRSDRLGCATEEDPASDGGIGVTLAEAPACIAELQAQWGPLLGAFNGTEAAHDVGALVDATRAPGQQVFVYGTSYGSQWAHRYLQLYPTQPTAVALDSICVPNCFIDRFDANFDALGKVFLDLCGADAACAAKLGNDPWTTLGDALAALGTTCTALDSVLAPEDVKAILAHLLYSRHDSPLVAPIVYRLQRCSPADVDALTHLAAVFSAPPSTPEYDSPMLGVQITLTEGIHDPPPDLATLQAEEAGYRVSLGSTVYMRQLYDLWPRYPRDAYWGKFATTSVPILMVDGDLDFIPKMLVDPVGAQFHGPGQNLVYLPWTFHGSLGQSPLVQGGDAELALLGDFVAMPTSTPNAAWASQIEPIDFDVPPTLSTQFFGTPDAWEGDPGPQPLVLHPVAPLHAAFTPADASRKAP